MNSNYQKLKNRWFGLLYGEPSISVYLYTLVFGISNTMLHVEPENIVDVLVSRECKGMQYDPVGGDIYEFTQIPVSD